ncbi:MAG: 5-(carboxyamino)imidazole ribonucleotide mutase [Candidatus Calescibacterium sp.]|jgi:5-(carboxyamino)imidazole ribonucleotide mutase|nr:5-(carboxyamino)imidazole ribonucleotide mutase [Candidatus Calescibacterium sp.]
MPKVAIIMGSKNDWEYMKEAYDFLKSFDVEVEAKVVSAHRTPDYMFSFAKNAKDEGFEVIIAGAGGAAHLPGMVASLTTLPVIGVPIPTKQLNGLDSLLSIVQMPYGVPVATVAIGNAKNAALLALRILSIKYDDIAEKLKNFAEKMKNEVLSSKLEI